MNDGFFAGQRETPLAEAEVKYKVSERTPHQKGEFRKAYWRGRIHATWTFKLSGCIQYMNTDDCKVLWARMEMLYRQTLTDMYGKEGAKKFIEETEGG